MDPFIVDWKNGLSDIKCIHALLERGGNTIETRSTNDASYSPSKSATDVANRVGGGGGGGIGEWSPTILQARITRVAQPWQKSYRDLNRNNCQQITTILSIKRRDRSPNLWYFIWFGVLYLLISLLRLYPSLFRENLVLNVLPLRECGELCFLVGSSESGAGTGMAIHWTSKEPRPFFQSDTR